MTEEVKEKLKLNVKRTEQLNLNTFGSEKSERKRCSLVYLNLEVGNNEPPVEISALSYPAKCTPINARIDLNDYPHIQGLKLADANISKHNKPIVVLVGAYSYYEIVTDEIIKGNSSQLQLTIN